MPGKLSVTQLRLMRAAGQCLQDAAEPVSLTGVVAATVGINAQRSSAMMLSLRARMRGVERSDINEAVNEHRVLVRTWAMRGTLHLVDAKDLHWLIAELGPIASAKTGRRRIELGLDDGILPRALEEMKAVMNKAGPMTRWELMDSLAGRGVVLEKKSQAPFHLLAYAALSGLICLGPERENAEPTYVLLDKWVGRAKAEPGGSTISRLALRYLRGYGPATVNDFSAWSGVPMRGARDAWNSLVTAGEVDEVEIAGRPLWVSAEGARSAGINTGRRPLVRLLPAFDSYVLGYADREFLIPKDLYKHVYHGGQTLPTIMMNGAIVGVWRYTRKGKRLIVELSPFDPLDGEVHAMVIDEAHDVGRFFDLPVTVRS